MKNAFTIWLALCLCGCATVLSRQDAYSVLPIKPTTLEKYRAETYSLITLPYPAGLNTLENGTAWELLVRFSNGDTETTMATFMAHWDETENKLTFLMGDKSRGSLFALLNCSPTKLAKAKAVLFSHDHNYCGHLATGATEWCADKDSINWQNAADLPPFATEIKPESPADAEILRAYAAAMKNQTVKEKNFALSPEHWRIIEKQSSRALTWTRITVTGVVVGTVVSFIATPLVGIASGALTASTQSIGEATVPPNINFPEYASGLARRSEQTTLATQLKQLDARIRSIEPKTTKK